ncbi:MAG TPA: hypothetical protein VGM27_13965 [Acidobacteriaceae bacterium]|jgi:hypothetical protein
MNRAGDSSWQGRVLLTAWISEFTKFVGSMCARKMLNVYQLSQRLGIDPAELLDMVNGKKIPTKAVVAKELDWTSGIWKS